jgi:hypothetical protein
MFKIAFVLVLTMCIAISQGFLTLPVGSYGERPELIKDQVVQALTSYAAEYLARTQNLVLKNLTVIRVQTQVVAGVNYKIDFKAQPVNGVDGQTTTCQVTINVRWDAMKNILQSQCQTS